MQAADLPAFVGLESGMEKMFATATVVTEMVTQRLSEGAVSAGHRSTGG